MAEGRDRQREETRRRVYEAALVFFRRDGVAACRVDDIIRAAGVSRGAFYFHFPSKDHVLLDLSREREAGIAAAIDRLPESATIAEVLDAVGEALAAAWEPDPRLLPEVAAAVLRLPGIVSDPESLLVRAALARRFRTAAARDELSNLLPGQLLSDFFLANAMGGMLGWCGYPVVPLRDVLGTVAKIFLEGAGHRGPARGARKGGARRPKGRR